MRACAGSLAGSLLCYFVTGVTPVLAQVALEEITVTARKQNESLLDVPLSVAVMTNKAM